MSRVKQLEEKRRKAEEMWEKKRRKGEKGNKFRVGKSMGKQRHPPPGEKENTASFSYSRKGGSHRKKGRESHSDFYSLTQSTRDFAKM